MEQHSNSKHTSAIALFSGGLDSILAVKWMQNLGFRVYAAHFSAPYLPPEKAIHYARENGIELIVRDITAEHLQMMQNPVHGFGKHHNPCIDCHGLMFRMAGKLMEELGADFLISGEVLGQRPMSQHRNALRAVEKLSGYGDLIIRPLSQKLLEDTKPVREVWVDKAALLDISGRSRNRQMAMAKEMGITYPAPGGGCLLTDRSYTLRLRELLDRGEGSPENIRLLRWGRHFRLADGIKLIVGRNQADNEGLQREAYHGIYLKLRDWKGPLGLLTSNDVSGDLLARAASIVLSYSGKATSPAYVKYGIDNICDREILVGKLGEAELKQDMIAYD